MTAEIVKPRCSSLDRIMSCPASLIKPVRNIDSASEAATIGHAAHKICESFPIDAEPGIEVIAREYNLQDKADELRMLYFMARKIWLDIMLYFKTSHKVEYKFNTEVLSGTADLVSVSTGITGARVAINDWKSGYGQSEHIYQITGYAYCAAQEFGLKPDESVIGIESWIRHGSYRLHKISYDDIQRFEQKLLAAIDNAKSDAPTYNPSEHCTFCRRLTECGAYAEFSRASCNALLELEKPTTAITKELLGAMYHRVKGLKRAIDNYDKLLKNSIEHSGAIPIDSTSAIDYVEQTKDKIDVTAVYKALMADGRYTNQEFINAVSITKTALTQLIGAKAAPRQKSKDTKTFLDILQNNGGVIKTSYKKLQVVKK